MAEPEVEAAWRAEFERSGVKELRDALSDDGLTDELKRQAAFRWPGDEAEAQRLQQEQTYHYVRWIFLIAVAAERVAEFFHAAAFELSAPGGFHFRFSHPRSLIPS